MKNKKRYMQLRDPQKSQKSHKRLSIVQDKNISRAHECKMENMAVLLKGTETTTYPLDLLPSLLFSGKYRVMTEFKSFPPIDLLPFRRAGKKGKALVQGWKWPHRKFIGMHSPRRNLVFPGAGDPLRSLPGEDTSPFALLRVMCSKDSSVAAECCSAACQMNDDIWSGGFFTSLCRGMRLAPRPRAGMLC